MQFENRTAFIASHGFGRAQSGRESLLVFLKATFSWKDNQELVLVDEGEPLLDTDVFVGESGTSSLDFAGETSPPKPRTDVYLRGHVHLTRAQTQIDVSLKVGELAIKTIRVFGDRVWRAGISGQNVASAPKPFVQMPLAWERACGGIDARDPRRFEPRNPIGRGFVHTGALEGSPLPNFEAPHAPADCRRPGAPVGFGPIAPHWTPRAEHAGTYDSAWRDMRAPLLPDDFDSRFFNAAPEDQQLMSYPEGGTITLTNFTPRGQESFVVPPFRVPVTLADDGYLVDREIEGDTIVIDLDRRLVLIRGALEYVPRATIADVNLAIVGAITTARRTALLRGKRYVRLSDCRGPGGRDRADSSRQT
jgi:hypothetical protein